MELNIYKKANSDKGSGKVNNNKYDFTTSDEVEQDEVQDRKVYKDL